MEKQRQNFDMIMVREQIKKQKKTVQIDGDVVVRKKKVIEILEELKANVPYNRLIDTVEDSPKLVGKVIAFDEAIRAIEELDW